MLSRAERGNKEVKVMPGLKNAQKLNDKEIVDLAKIAHSIEKHYYFPQDIEWAKEGNRLYIVQTRPITTIGKKGKDDNMLVGNAHAYLKGEPASPGIGTGHVKKIHGVSDISKVKFEDVLVAESTNPDYVPAMKKAKAIITEKGGRTSHAAIVAREFGIPAVVGVPSAREFLKDDEIVTVNGKSGEVFKGRFSVSHGRAEDSMLAVKTATKILVNMAEPSLASSLSQTNVDGVGLLRAEFILAQIGIHPKKAIQDGKKSDYIKKLAQDVGEICRAFYPRPVLYRATDFKTNEYRNLSGGKQFEPQESNPMLGYRGAFRYVHDPEVFKLELKAIRKIREKMGYTNLNLMIPFVRTVKEFVDVKKIIFSEGLRRSHSFKIYMMVEVPSNVVLIEEFIKTGLDGVSIGSNDLTMLMLGIDRDNEEVATEFDERNPAVLWAIEKVIKVCHENSVQVSICGQAPSVYPALVETLVKWGIDSISVSPDAVSETRRIVYLSEEKIVKRK
jgi:pyruvate,water dikinase